MVCIEIEACSLLLKKKVGEAARREGCPGESSPTPSSSHLPSPNPSPPPRPPVETFASCFWTNKNQEALSHCESVFLHPGNTEATSHTARGHCPQVRKSHFLQLHPSEVPVVTSSIGHPLLAALKPRLTAPRLPMLPEVPSQIIYLHWNQGLLLGRPKLSSE